MSSDDELRSRIRERVASARDAWHRGRPGEETADEFLTAAVWDVVAEVCRARSAPSDAQVEAAARYLFDYDAKPDLETWDADADDDARQLYRGIARSILAAAFAVENEDA